jgi:ABC-type multidrug transport system permease subunit
MVMEKLQFAQVMLSQLSSLSTYLGGFSLVFLGAIISISNHDNKAAQITVVMSAVSSVFFILCAVGWGLLQLNATIVPSDLDEKGIYTLLESLFSQRHKYLSIMFLIGLVGFLVCVAASGFIYNKRTGRLTAGIGLTGFIAMTVILSPYVTLSS